MIPSNRYGIRLRVRGELGPAWSAVFADLALEPEPDGTTLIRGEVCDQAALHGLLAAIRDLGLSLISMTVVVISRQPAKPLRPMPRGRRGAVRQGCPLSSTRTTALDAGSGSD